MRSRQVALGEPQAVVGFPLQVGRHSCKWGTHARATQKRQVELLGEDDALVDILDQHVSVCHYTLGPTKCKVHLREENLGPVLESLLLFKMIDMLAQLQRDPPSTQAVCGETSLCSVADKIVDPIPERLRIGDDARGVAGVHMDELARPRADQ